MRNLLLVIIAASLIITFLSWSKKDPKKEPSVRKVDVVTLEERTQKKIKKLHEVALTYQQAGEWKEALHTWKDIVNTYPEDEQTAQALQSLVVLYLNKSQTKFANIYFEKLEQGFPDSEAMAQALYDKAQYADKGGNLSSAKLSYRRLVRDFFFFDKIAEVQKRLEDLNISLLFSKKITEGTSLYQVQRGDSLSTIAHRFNTTVDFLLQANGLKIDSVIHPGDRLKVFNPKVKIGVTIDKSQKSMLLTFNNEVLRRYNIAIGKDGSTLVGKFAVQNKLKDPVWFNAGRAIPPDDPRNVLGTRWLGIDRDIGIHGTVEKKHILEQTSNGCIRMNNKEVEQLYSILRVGDPVVIVE